MVESHLEQLTEHLTEEEQDVRNSDKENKEKKLEGKLKEKVSEPTMHKLKRTYLENKKQTFTTPLRQGSSTLSSGPTNRPGLQDNLNTSQVISFASQ